MNIKDFLNRHALKCIVLGFCTAFVLIGCGVAGYVYADSPAFCGSCHSMAEARMTWAASNHKNIACTECHLPHNSLPEKMIAKATTGMSDTYHEVLRDYPAHIRLSDQGEAYVNDNCLRCHSATMENVQMIEGSNQNCLKCHSGIVHGANMIEGGIKIE